MISEGLAGQGQPAGFQSGRWSQDFWSIAFGEHQKLVMDPIWSIKSSGVKFQAVSFFNLSSTLTGQWHREDGSRSFASLSTEDQSEGEQSLQTWISLFCFLRISSSFVLRISSSSQTKQRTLKVSQTNQTKGETILSPVFCPDSASCCCCCWYKPLPDSGQWKASVHKL